MDERVALSLVADFVTAAGDDCAVIDDLVVTTDMLHETTDFPDGTSRYTAGWRSVAASLSDVAAMGGDATAALAIYGAPSFEATELEAFLSGCLDACEAGDAEYVGGDLDSHDEFTVSTTVIGRADSPVLRSGARPGEAICVTGTLGRSAAAVKLFEAGDSGRANELFRFQPRLSAGSAIAPYASAMMDSSDGLARSLHQLAEASECGMAITSEDVPIDPEVEAVAETIQEVWELGIHFGEDFELVCTVPEASLAEMMATCPIELTRIGTVTESGVSMDGSSIPDRGYTHE